MEKFNTILIDPPWNFHDGLANKKGIKRSAKDNYSTLSFEELKSLNIESIIDKNAVIALWVPSSLLNEGLELLKSYGFAHKQTWIWVKTKKDPFSDLKKKLKKSLKENNLNIDELFKSFSIDSILGFGMGRIFRNCHEIALIGVRGKIYSEVKNKSQRTISFFQSTKHSTKPEILQDKLELIFPNLNSRIEFFARRSRKNWICVGNEAPGEFSKLDIREAIKKIKEKQNVKIDLGSSA